MHDENKLTLGQYYLFITFCGGHVKVLLGPVKCRNECTHNNRPNLATVIIPQTIIVTNKIYNRCIRNGEQ